MNPEHLTTHALGETLSPAERAALEQTLASDPQARADLDATRDFASFLQQHLASDTPEAALTEEQKQRLLITGGTSSSLARNQGDRAGRPTPLRWLQHAVLPLSAAALILIGLKQWQQGTLQDSSEIGPRLPHTKKQSEANAVVAPGASGTVTEGDGRSAPASPFGNQPQAATSTTLGGEVQSILRADDVNTASRRGMINPEEKGSGLAEASKDNDRARKIIEAKPDRQEPLSVTSATALAPIAANSPEAMPSKSPAAPKPQGSSAMTRLGDGELTLSHSNTYTGATSLATGDTMPFSGAIVVGSTGETRTPGMNSKNAAVGAMSPVPVATAAAPSVSAVAGREIRPQTATMPPADAISDFNEPATRPLFVTAREEKPVNESYTPIQENPLTTVVREPLSTFSIDVDTAAYANVRRFLNRSSLPPRDAVRLEELINYFPYHLEGPPPNSPHPFAVQVEVAACPWAPAHRLARIGIQGKRVGLEERNSNFVFLVDVSGSMDQPDKLPLVKASLRLLVEQLDEKDRVTLVTYAGSSGLVLPPTPGDQKQRLLAAIDHLSSGGSTHGSAGLQLAYEQAIAAFIPEGVNRVILCTDGDFNVGVASPEELENLITEKARSGVFLSVLGFGTGNLKDRTMETLADKGNGNYAYLDSLSEARKVLVEQMSGTLITIAKDVKIQVEFNPAQVASYRLIGYENRLLAKEDFNDDTKDAGEIGAGHSVTALYEIVPVGVTPPTAPVDALKYQTPTPSTAPAAEPASNELLTVKLRYKAPDGATSQLIEVPVTDPQTTLAAASPEFKFTTAVAAYGLMLRQSSYRGALNWEQIRRLALEGKGTDTHGYRAEFLQLLDKARGLLPDQP